MAHLRNRQESKRVEMLFLRLIQCALFQSTQRATYNREPFSESQHHRDSVSVHAEPQSQAVYATSAIGNTDLDHGSLLACFELHSFGQVIPPGKASVSSFVLTMQAMPIVSF